MNRHIEYFLLLNDSSHQFGDQEDEISTLSQVTSRLEEITQFEQVRMITN